MIEAKRVGEQIAAFRKKKGLTGEKFAELLGVSPQAVSKWENGKNLPETALLPAIAKCLNASVDSILVPQALAYRIHPKKKTAAYTGRGWPHSNAYPALFAAVALFFGQENRLNEKGEQINDDFHYHLQAALTSEAYGVQYSELFEADGPARCLGIYGLAPRVIDCSDLEERQIRGLICASVSKDVPVIVEPKKQADILFVFGYKEGGKVLCCCAFQDGADKKNASYDFVKFRPLRNRTHEIRRIIILEETGKKTELSEVCTQSLRHGLQMMTAPTDKMNFEKLRGAGGGLYDAWIALLQQANEEGNDSFYMAFPVFPQLLILYENRLHLSEFLKAYAKLNGEASLLLQAQKKCEELELWAMEAAQIGFQNAHTKPDVLAMTNSERRGLLIEILRRCRGLEQEMVALLQEFVS